MEIEAHIADGLGMDAAGSRIQDGRFSGSQDGRSPVGVNQSSFLVQ